MITAGSVIFMSRSASGENDETTTESSISCSLMSAATFCTTPCSTASGLISTLIRIRPLTVSRTSVRVGIFSPWILGCEPGTGVELSDLREGHVGGQAAPVGGAVEGLVMETDDVAVGGHGDIHLDHVGADLDGLLDGDQGVLRRLTGKSTVGDHSGWRVWFHEGLDGCGTIAAVGEERRWRARR